MKNATVNIKKDKLARTEQLEFLEYLKNSLANGFSLNNSIELMPVLWPKRAKLMQNLVQKMKTGSTLAQELLRLGFSKTTVTQINLAMQQGNLIECLRQLAILQRIKNEQIKKLRAELTYPFVLAIMMIILLLFMQTFVVGQLSNGDEHTGDHLLLLLIILVLALAYLFAHILSLLSKQDYHSLKSLSHYPVIGKAVTLYVHYLLIYDIGLLLAGGFSLQKMCLYASKQEKDSLQQHLGKKVADKLSSGQDLKSIIKQEEFLPDKLLILLETGSQRNNLSKSCLLLGKSLFNDLVNKIEKMVVNVQPFCFILIGFCIIGMYLKLLLPMYAMMQGM